MNYKISKNTLSMNAELPKWDLSNFYTNIQDPQIDIDVNHLISLANDFYSFKGKLSTNLEEALKIDIKMSEIENKIFVYFSLLLATHAGDENILKKQSIIEEKCSKQISPLTAYFPIELGNLDNEIYDKQVSNSELLKKHETLLNQIRLLAKHNLSENVEIAISKRSPFGVGVWDEIMDELDTKIKFKNPKANWINLFNKKSRFISFQEILHILSTDKSAKIRFSALKIINDTLKYPSSDIGGFSYSDMRAKALNNSIGYKNVSDLDRKFSYAMESRNIENMVDKETVNALHTAIETDGVFQAKRYYKIISKLLHKKILNWSDRNAPMPFTSTKKIKWEEAVNIVRSAYASFSSEMVQLFDEIIQKKHIDADIYSGKTTGAFSCSLTIPDNQPDTYVFLNYQGSIRDVMTLAHEMGHSIHGLLAGRKQGVLMQHAPLCYAETASIFGEMITFRYLLKYIDSDIDKLALLLEKSGDWMNSVVRQISFSVFEQKIHDMRNNGKISVSDFNNVWVSVTKKFYGNDNEIFNYSNMDAMWSYVGHFMRPFYVYSYAFGELFTQSLFAEYDKFGHEQFKELYLDMLKSGDTRNAVELMKPFNLNPNNENFWKNGIKCSVTKWLDEVEQLIEKLKI